MWCSMLAFFGTDLPNDARNCFWTVILQTQVRWSVWVSSFFFSISPFSKRYTVPMGSKSKTHVKCRQFTFLQVSNLMLPTKTNPVPNFAKKTNNIPKYHNGRNFSKAPNAFRLRYCKRWNSVRSCETTSIQFCSSWLHFLQPEEL